MNAKPKPIGKQPQHPVIDQHTSDFAGDGPSEQRGDPPVPTPPADAAATFEQGDQSTSSTDGGQAGAGSGKPTALSIALADHLTDEQLDALNRFKHKQAQPNCTKLGLGLELIDIIRNQRLPVRGDMVKNCDELLGLTRIQVRELVEQAKEHLSQSGVNPSSPRTDIRASGAGASKQPPASPPEGAAGDESSAAPDPIPASEQKHALTKKPMAAEAAAPQAGEPAEVLTPLPVAPAQPVTPNPARADARATEHLTDVSGGPAVNGPSKKPQQASKRAANEAKVGTALTPIDQEKRLLQLETIVQRGFTSLWEIGKAMLEIRDRQLYLKRYNTFQEYCATRWGKQRSRCYQLMAAAEVQQNLVSTQVDSAELTEKHCRELGKLKKPADQRIAWKEAAAAAPDGKVTLPCLKEVVAKLRPPSRTMAARKAKAMTEAEDDAEAVGSEDVLPDRPPEKAVAIQPEAPPANSSAPFATDDFDLHEEWRIVEDSLRNLFCRCPKYQHAQLWELLRRFEHDPEATPPPRRGRRVLFRPPQ